MAPAPLMNQPEFSRKVSRARRGDIGCPRRSGINGRLLSAVALILCLLPGCVTEYSGGTQRTSDPDATLDKRVALARQYIGVGDWENAKRNLELAQEIDPQNAEVFEAFALVYQSTGEFERAELQFEARAHATTMRLISTLKAVIPRRKESFGESPKIPCTAAGPWRLSIWGYVNCSCRTRSVPNPLLRGLWLWIGVILSRFWKWDFFDWKRVILAMPTGIMVPTGRFLLSNRRGDYCWG
jgi:tetratricopeptide (TPR) repeat protein